MENIFIVRYRRALRELQEAYRLQYALVDESDALRTLAYQQAHTVEKAILKNRKSGRGFLISRLRECLDEEPHAWAITQHIKREIEEMEASRYDSEVSDEQNHALYLVIEDAICELLEVFGSQFPKMLTGAAIATYRGNVLVSELVLKFGPTHLQRIVRQRLKAAVDNYASTTTETVQPGSLALETPAPSPWRPLLTGLLKLPALFEFFADCELLTPAGELTALGRADGQNKARKAPWAGTLQALIQSRHLDGNTAAICRALSDPAGGIKVSLSEGTLREYSAKAETYLALANGYLEKRGILRK